MALRNLTAEELEAGLAALPGWSVEGGALVRTFRFPSFREAVAFVNRVADEAEAADHHPDLDVRYDRVRVATHTHVTGGITHRDLDLARRIDAVAYPSPP